jgi:hypothetical protein
MYFCAWFSPIIPLGIPFTIVTLFLLYWSKKYNLLRRSTLKEKPGAEISFEMLEMLEYFCVIYSAGTLTFDYIFSESLSPIVMAGCALGILNAFLPMGDINEKLFPIKDKINADVDYYTAYKKHFETTYDCANPVTHEEAHKAMNLHQKA